MTDTTNTGSALKPCPFCNGKASFKPRSFKASCDRCGAHVPVGATDSGEAITAWNTRADLTDAIVQAALEATLAELKGEDRMTRSTCTTCFANRKGQFYHVGEVMCWVCRWLVAPLPAWLSPTIYKVFGGWEDRG